MYSRTEWIFQSAVSLIIYIFTWPFVWLTFAPTSKDLHAHDDESLLGGIAVVTGRVKCIIISNNMKENN